MKKIFLFFILFLCACAQITTPSENYNKNVSIECENIEQVNWADKEKTIKTYNVCIKYKANKNKQNYDTTRKAQTDSKLYLSYIYLTPGKYENIEQANVLLNGAISEMTAECKNAHGPHDNFCYMTHFKQYEKIPANFQKLDDATHLYHMSLPCIYIDMIKEYPKKIELVGGYFGSSRDVNIPNICNDNSRGPYSVFSVQDLEKIDSYKHVQSLNNAKEETGTIRFGYRRSYYQKAVELLLFPEQALKEFEQDGVNITEQTMTDIPDAELKKFYAKDIEEEIYKYEDLKDVYEKIISKAENYYIKELGLDKVTAQKYARMATQLVLLQRVYGI